MTVSAAYAWCEAGRLVLPFSQGKEDFDIREPEHVILAGTLGLGVPNRNKIDHRGIALG